MTVYIDSIFEHHTLTQGGVTRENNTLHVMDNQSRIALVRVGEAFPGDGTADKPMKYHLGDHLGSSNIVIDDSGNFINREEYTPYGETSFGSFAKKRYRFTGKERDEESGLYYHGARYYAPWLGRWVSCDPAGMVDGPNLYCYAKNRPTVLVDLARQRGVMPIILGTKAPVTAGGTAAGTLAAAVAIRIVVVVGRLIKRWKLCCLRS